MTFKPFREWYSNQKDGSRPKRKQDMIQECGFSWVTINKITHDRFPVRTDIIETICKVYNLELNQVIAYERGVQDSDKV